MKKVFTNPFTGKAEVNELSESPFFTPPPTKKPKKKPITPTKKDPIITPPPSRPEPIGAIVEAPVVIDIMEITRKAVKRFGKEAATYRFTVEEKKALSSIIYTYKAQGIKTSENEIARIAINYILGEYRQNGQSSILDQLLQKLHL